MAQVSAKAPPLPRPSTDYCPILRRVFSLDDKEKPHSSEDEQGVFQTASFRPIQ